MESSIAEFLSRKLACELLPTSNCRVCLHRSCCFLHLLRHSLAHAFIELRFASWFNTEASQRSLHNAPIFRLLLKVAVNGTHQCDFLNFCGGFGSQQSAHLGDIGGLPSLKWVCIDGKKIVYTSRFVRVILAQGPC